MGLDTTHDCWHGAYSAFMRWRKEIARAAGLPPLELMEGFWDTSSPLHNPFWQQLDSDKKNGFDHSGSVWFSLPIRWNCLRPSPLHKLLYHSDCEGSIAWKDCKPIADALQKLLPNLPDGDAGGHIGNWRDKTEQFIKGLRAAHRAKERVKFH